MKQLTGSVFYTGVMNPGMRVFDVVMRTEYGTSYNSYVVKGSEKTALIEASHLTFFDGYLENIQEALGGKTPDYLVIDHCETDHTGCVAKLLATYPGLTIIVSQAGAIYLKQIINNPGAKIQTVKNGESISLGDKTLTFFSAPFLHWPDSMFTWLPEDKVLFTCDFLGCHFCEPMVLDSHIVYHNEYWEAVRHYYDCIFGPFGSYVRKGLDIVRGLDVEIAANSHGPVLTKGVNLERVIALYDEASAPAVRTAKKIPIFYCSAYGNTENIALAIANGVGSELPDAEVGLYDIIGNEMPALAALMNESDAFLIGSPTINRDAVPPVWQLLSGIEAVGIVKRPVAVFGSYGWSGEALPHVMERLASVKANVFERQFGVLFVPTAADLEAAEAFGAEFARSL